MDLITDSGASRSLILSAAELMVHEGMKVEKSMYFRDGGAQLSVLVDLPREDGYHSSWDPQNNLFIFEGHDSLAEGAAGNADDQLLMYASGKPTENGKFYRAANQFKDELLPEPHRAQVYEKLDAGVFFDKGIFELVDATYKTDGTRKVVKLFLKPVDAELPLNERVSWDERMLSASQKAEAWKAGNGRCTVCGVESGLHFTPELRCSSHRA